MNEPLLNNLKGTEKQMNLGRPFNVVCYSLFLAILLFAECSSFAAQPPNGGLKVAYRQRVEGKLSESVHYISLWCSDGQCSLTSLTLNQRFPGDDYYYPKIERTSTQEGNLSVSEIRDGVLIVEEKHSGATIKYRFTYTVRSDQELSKMVNLQQVRWFEDLNAFSGALVKYSSILKKVVSWEFVPLKGRSPIIKTACKIMLDGVPE